MRLEATGVGVIRTLMPPHGGFQVPLSSKISTKISIEQPFNVKKCLKYENERFSAIYLAKI